MTKMLDLFYLVFLTVVVCTSAGKQSFDSGIYVVEWRTLSATKEIEFNITAKAAGWVGLGISKENVGMKKLDVVVGGFNASGVQYLWDMYVDHTTRPTEDSQQDVKFVSGSERNGITNLCFKRKLDTGDESKDNVIEVGESYYLAWALESSKDATDPSNFKWHTKKGYSASTILASAEDSGTTASPTSSSVAVTAISVRFTFLVTAVFYVLNL